MKLQTQIKLNKQDFNLINYKSKLLLLGSCFSDNIGNKFEYFKFQSIANPFGILFHPKAIETLIVKAVNRQKYTEKEIFFHNEQWHCFDAHSQLSYSVKEELLNNLNNKLKLTNKQVKECSHIIITLGTAWVYKHLDTNTTVANCHKVPQKKFTKKLLSQQEIVSSLENIASKINEVNKKTTIIFTVSPVRHIKDGFVENTLSKSHLIAAIHQFINSNSVTGNYNSCYFPSFEIMLDELRDYRFYKADMLHPNETAIEYIWEKFNTTWMSSEAKNTMKVVENIQRSMQHRPFNPKSEAHQKFLENLEINKLKLQKQHKHILF